MLRFVYSHIYPSVTRGNTIEQIYIYISSSENVGQQIISPVGHQSGKPPPTGQAPPYFKVAESWSSLVSHYSYYFKQNYQEKYQNCTKKKMKYMEKKTCNENKNIFTKKKTQIQRLTKYQTKLYTRYYNKQKCITPH